MKPILIAAALSAIAAPAISDVTYDPNFYLKLKQIGLHEEAFLYVLNWAGAGDGAAETTVAYALMTGDGVAENPAAAIAIACQSRAMEDIDLRKILIEANLRMAGQDFTPIRCAAYDRN